MVRSRCSRPYITVIVIINITAYDVIRPRVLLYT